MTKWTSEELNKIGTAEELEIAPLRRNGTPRNPVTIWAGALWARVGDDLYVRSYRGRDGAWFRAAQVRHEGRIRAGGVEKDVIFVEDYLLTSGMCNQLPPTGSPPASVPG